MGQEGDDQLALPVPPPPRPAARTAAIDAALRRFDGIEEPAAPVRPRPQPWWSTIHRRPVGAFITAALVAVIAIPVIQVAVRDDQREAATENARPGISSDNAIAESIPANEPPAQAQAGQADQVAATKDAPLAAKPPAIEERANQTAADNKAETSVAPALAAPSPMLAAPPPPPPPPPAPAAAEPQAEASDVGNIVVTGSRIPSANAKSSGFAQRTEAPLTAREIAAPYGAFLNRLQEALGDNDRRAVLRLVGLPLRVNFAGGARTYRSSQGVERDYDRIFTPAVREAAQGLGTTDITNRDGGRLRGSGRIWFGCGLRTCSDEGVIRVREVTP